MNGKKRKCLLALLLSVCILLTIFPVTAFAVDENETTQTEDTYDVLMFSTRIEERKWDEYSTKRARIYIQQVFEEAGYKVNTKISIGEEQHLTEADMEGIGLLILFFPYVSLNDSDVALMREFLQGGGRIVMIGEHGKYAPVENAVLSQAAKELGGSFTISEKAVGGRYTIRTGTAQMPETALTEGVSELSCNHVAPISYTGSVQPVLYYKDSVWAVDQAVEKGRILAISDINCFDPLWYSKLQQTKQDTKTWILNWLKDARNNQEIVLSNKDPNLGFGGSPIVSADVGADNHISISGDYSFTVTYTGSDESSNGVIDTATIGTDDVTVKDENGEELLINHAEIISGAGTKELTVRYTVEAQQTGYFTPGDYTISVVNASVADMAGKQVSGKTLATFTVVDLPVEITGPENVSIPKEGSASLSVSAKVADSASEFGPFSYSYQWYQKKGSSYEKIDGADEASYELPESVTGIPGQYTYRCECKVTLNDGSSVLVNSKDAVVTVLRDISIDTPTATEQNGSASWLLSAKLLDAGGDTIVETGFVWGIMGSPTLSLNNGQAKTGSPVTTTGSSISVTANNLAAGVSYYARAYAKTAGGRVVYSAPRSFGSTGSLGTFAVQNNGNNTFTVTLTGGKGEQMVFYRTVNGSAVGGTHFEHTSGVLVFKAGETKKTITVTEHDVSAAYNGNAATGYSNADRTYSLELYSTMGGASVSESGASAVRTMTKSDAYTVNRNVYTDWFLGYTTEKDRVYRIDDSGWDDIFNFYADLSQNAELKQKSGYLNATATDYQFYFVLECHEVNDGYQYMKVSDTSGKGSAQAINWEIKSGSRADSWRSGAYFPSSTATGSMNDIVSQNWECTGLMSWVKDANREYLDFANNEPGTLVVSFDAGGSGDDDWEWRNLEQYYRPGDTKEPTLLAVAPMAQTAYAARENITIALIFDEIVDETNSTLANVSIETNLTGTLQYTGGANTNVLYFTGKVTNAFNGGEIQVTKINGTESIKDMADGSSTPADAASGSTNITLSDSAAPTVTVSNEGITESVASAAVNSTNANTLKYCWTNSASMPAAGWLTANKTTGVTLTSPVTETGTYYLHVMAINTTSGNAAYKNTSFTVAADSLIYLNASTDNSQWAQSRGILLETGGEGTLTVKKPDGTTETLASDVTVYTALENGNYTFTFTGGGKTVEKVVKVERIDQTSPEVSFSALPSGWQAEFPNITISGNDGTGTNDSGIASFKYMLVTERGTYPEIGLTDVTLTDGAASDQRIDGSGAVNGINYIYYVAKDKAGNITQGYSSAIKLDTTTPTITVGASVSEGAAAMFDVESAYGVSGGTVTFTRQDSNSQWPVSGTAESDGSGGYTFTATPGVSEEGTYVFTVTTGAGKTAQFNAPAICRVTLHAGDGSFDPTEDTVKTSTWLVVSGGTVTPPTAENQEAPTRSGYTLNGWYTDEDLEQEYDSDQTVTSDLDLYAGWDLDTYKIQYELNGGSLGQGVKNPETYTVEDNDITLKEPEKEGHIFLGWSGTDLKENTREVVIPKGSTGDREYTANWAEVVVTMEDWTYGDTPNEPVLGEDSNPGGSTVTYTYYTDSRCTTETTTAEGADKGGGKPTYAGTYYVKADVAASAGYHAASGTGSFTIEQKVIGIEWGTSEFTYTGTEQAPTAAATGLEKGDTCIITVTGAQTDANEKTGKTSYTAEATSVSNKNYKLPETGLTREYTINQAGLTIQWTNTKLTYNGLAQKPTATPEGAVNGETVDVSVSGEQTEPNESGKTYTATASVADKNYVIKTNETTEFEITYLPFVDGMYTLSGTKGDNDWYVSNVEVLPSEGYTISETLNSTYIAKLLLTKSTGQDYTIYLKNVNGQMTGGITVGVIKIDKDNPVIQVSGNTSDYLQSDTVQITATDSISGVAKVEVKKDNGEFEDITNSYGNGYTVSENGNYTFRVVDYAGNKAETSIAYNNIDTTKPMVQINAVTSDGKDYEDGSWTNRNVTLTLENTAGNLGTTRFQYKEDGGEWKDYTAALMISDDTDTDGITYTFRAFGASGVESEEKTFTVKRDTVAPDGDVAVKENSIRQFLNSITFGLFFNETLDVEITGTDALSGVDSIEYYRTDEILTEEQVKALTEWTAYDSIRETAVDAEQFIYYIKVTDRAGNTFCFASNGIIFDLTKPLVEGIIDGGTYYTTQKPVVTDLYLDTVTLNTQPVSGSITLTGDMDMIYTIAASDRAGNETVVTIVMKPIASLADPIDDMTGDAVTSDDRPTIEDVLDKVDAVDTENATEEEKEALQKIRDDCSELLDKIDETEEEITDVIDGVNDYDEDAVNSEDTADIERLIEDAEKLLQIDNVTEEEKDILNEIIEKGKDLLDRIDEAAQAADTDAVQETEQITKDTVTLEDKEKLTEALEDLESALENFDGNYTETEMAEIQEDLERILEALQTIENVEKVIEKIKNLPGPGSIAVSDEEALSEAQSAYDMLTDYEKSLLGTRWKDVLDKAWESLEQAKEEAKRTGAPSAGDAGSLWPWCVLMLFSGGTVLLLKTKRKKH